LTRTYPYPKVRNNIFGQKKRRTNMATATLTSKGQITIPVAVREKLGVAAGDRLEFVELSPGEFALKAATEDVRALKGMIRRPGKPVPVDAMNAAIKRRGSSR